MADVNTFIDAMGKDVNSAVAPKVETLTAEIGAKALADYVPKVSAFAHQLVKEIVDEQSVVVRDFATALIQDLFTRYRPDFAGNLRTRIVQDGVELVGEGIRLDLKRRDTGALVSSLDIPVSVKIHVDGLALNIQDTTIKLDVVR
jgi:hypothetical protein